MYVRTGIGALIRLNRAQSYRRTKTIGFFHKKPMVFSTCVKLGISGQLQIAVLHPVGLAAELVDKGAQNGGEDEVIEKDPEQLKRLDAFDDYSFGGTALVGDPTDPDTLRQGGIDSCDAVAAVSEDDSVNLMAAQIAKSIFRREKVICRVSDPHLQVLYHKAYEIDTICPTVLTEQSVFRALAK